MQTNDDVKEPCRTGREANSKRIAALDFTKGALVLFMVLYHWINYFIGPQWPYYRFLRFLTPSFIFITGFMISHLYVSKYDVSALHLLKRLVTRGLKLIGIFFFLNLSRDCLLPLLHDGKVDVGLLQGETLRMILITGASPTKAVSFYILLPIAQLLVLSGVLMLPQRRFQYTFHTASLSIFILLGMLEIVGVRNQNLEIVGIGMLGVLVGFARIDTINEFVRHPFLLALAYLAYVVAITMWDVPYPLEVVGTFLTVTIIYLLGALRWKFKSTEDLIILLGKYSLFGYIIQIVFLQLLAGGLRRLALMNVALVISLVAAFALTIGSILLLDRARRAFSSVAVAYKAVFG